MKVSLPILVMVLSIVSLCAGEVSFQYPSREGRKFSANDIIDDRPKVVDALRCIRGEKCNLPRKYSKFLRESGPTLVVFGRCPAGKCSEDEEAKARQLLHEIAIRYSKVFYYTYEIVRRWFPRDI